MTSRWVFITSSYWSTFLRVWKFRDSTCFWAFSMALVSIFCSMGVSSSTPSFSIMPITRSEPNRRMMSSSRDR